MPDCVIDLFSNFHSQIEWIAVMVDDRGGNKIKTPKKKKNCQMMDVVLEWSSFDV